MTTESEILAELLQNITLKEENATKLQTAEEIVRTTEDDTTKTTAETEVQGLKAALEELKEKELNLRGKIGLLPITAETGESKPLIGPARSSISFKLPQPEKFKRGENFNKFCQNISLFFRKSFLDCADVEFSMVICSIGISSMSCAKLQLSESKKCCTSLQLLS